MAREKQLDIFVEPTPKQRWLLEFSNPLLARFGKDFFAKIPKCPGVYKMRDTRGEIVYVGKAKDLRNRLRSYARANPDNSSRKTLRLVHVIAKIEWEELGSETSALLRENFLLRSLKPEFNVTNTSPHTYYFAHLKTECQGVRFHLAMASDESYPEIYGAFKGRGLVFDAQKALLRLLWMTFNECRFGFELPRMLTNRRPVIHHLFTLPERVGAAERLLLYRGLKRFYNGTSKGLLEALILKLLEREDLAPFTRTLIQQDIETILEFYEYGPRRNRRIRREFDLDSEPLAQDSLDDYLVLLKA
jgi:excinuclease ABC subunit C